MQKTIYLSLIDDDKLVVDLLKTFLHQKEGISVVSTASSGNEFIKLLENASLLPSIIILDLKMNDGNGIEVVEHLTTNYSSIKIIILSSYYKPSFLGYMLKMGVHAFLPKETDKFDLIKIIHEVFNKGHYFTSEQLEVVRSQMSNKVPILYIDSVDTISEREVEVLQLICQQYTAKEIGNKLHISSKTVETHKANLLLKTGMKNTAGLIIYAAKNKIINLDAILLLD